MGYLRDRLIGTIHKEECCCGDCNCEHEHNHQEEHLSEEEIEQIINEKYSEKDEKTKAFIRKGLSKFGNRFDYSKTVYINATEKIITGAIENDSRNPSLTPLPPLPTMPALYAVSAILP